jgi:hypothetical protein
MPNPNALDIEDGGAKILVGGVAKWQNACANAVLSNVTFGRCRLAPESRGSMAGPIIAGEHPRLQAIFTIVAIVFACFLLAHDVFMSRFGWLRALVNWGRHLLGTR